MNKYSVMSPYTLAAQAIVPEQLPAYVRAVSPLTLCFARGYAVYRSGEEAVLIGYPTEQALPGFYAGDSSQKGGMGLKSGISEHQGIDTENFSAGLDEAIAELCAWNGLSRLTVLSPCRPGTAPVSSETYTEKSDVYMALTLPCIGPGENFEGVKGQKLRNMLRRASRELTVSLEEWSGECASLAEHYASARRLEEGTRHIFRHLQGYAAAEGVRLFTARDNTGVLHGFCLGDFTPMGTAFYMFAFRRACAVPGAADLLLAALVTEAQRQGHARVNLGLAVNGGIAFFKHKWGAVEFLPQVECSWRLKIAEEGLWKRIKRGLTANSAAKITRKV